MDKPEATRRIVQWANKLNQFDIEYQLRTAIKAQALASFIAEFTSPEHEDIQGELWTIHTNGSSTQKRGRSGVIIILQSGDILKCVIQLKFPINNNEAGYKTILMGLRIA